MTDKKILHFYFTVVCYKKNISFQLRVLTFIDRNPTIIQIILLQVGLASDVYNNAMHIKNKTTVL